MIMPSNLKFSKFYDCHIKDPLKNMKGQKKNKKTREKTQNRLS